MTLMIWGSYSSCRGGATRAVRGTRRTCIQNSSMLRLTQQWARVGKRAAAARCGSLRSLNFSRGARRWFEPTRHKVVSVEDAARSVRTGDTIVASGFAANGVAEALLEALGDRFIESGEPSNLTCMFHAGPGDYGDRGLNHLARRRPDGSHMIKRLVGSFFGQTPSFAEIALNNEVEAYNFPMGSVSRMIRAAASGCPGHITRIGMGTFVDPLTGTGGKCNELTRERGRDLVTRISVEDQEFLFYKALPVDVAFVRGTTADSSGNVTFEHESLLTDARVMACAARASGGVVVAQVKHLAAAGSLRARDVHIPGTMVDCVVVVPPDQHFTLHPMSFFTGHNPSWSQEVREPLESLAPMPLNQRKVVSRRAAQKLRAGQIVNLGIGMPEGVAAVANEEGIMKYLTLTTEAGAVGGVAAGGHNFGPAANADCLQEMNQQFDFYNGGGLDICFLGAGQIGENGDVNVSRLSPTKLTGVGGFIDITQSTDKVVFMGGFTAGGLKVKIGDGRLQILQEGRIQKFVKEVGEVTFSGDIAMQQGQSALYITERAVFKRLPEHGKLMLVEIAPGVDLQKDVLDQMGFEPIISSKLKTMDECLFADKLIDLQSILVDAKLEDRISYEEVTHTMYVNARDLVVATEADVKEWRDVLESAMSAAVEKAGKKVDVVVNYEGFDCREEVTLAYSSMVAEIQEKYYNTVRRYSSKAFFRQKLGARLHMVDYEQAWEVLDVDGNGHISTREIRKGMFKLFGLKIPVQFLSHLPAPSSELGYSHDEFRDIYDHILEADLGQSDVLAGRDWETEAESPV